MKKFAIIRVEKLKNFGAIMASGQHTFRERSTPNADPQIKNQGAGARSSADLCQTIQKRLDGVVKRKDAVLCLEYLITASSEALEGVDRGKYFSDSLKWLQAKHGAENVVSATVHNDEQTPHMAIYVVPLVHQKETTRRKSVLVKGGGREVREIPVPAHVELNAKQFCGGREKLVALQTNFAAEVGAKFGMQRGVHRGVGDERVTRTEVKEWYEKKDGLLAELEEAARKQAEIDRRLRLERTALDGELFRQKQREAKLEADSARLTADRQALETDKAKFEAEKAQGLKLLAGVRAGLDQRATDLDQREAQQADRHDKQEQQKAEMAVKVAKFEEIRATLKANNDSLGLKIAAFRKEVATFQDMTKGYTPGQVVEGIKALEKANVKPQGRGGR